MNWNSEKKKKQMILVVDDSEINRQILSNMLREKYEILEAEDGEQALALLEQYGVEIALILLDELMPRMDGFHFMEEMNRGNWTDLIPVIMISAETSSSVVLQAFELGVVDFIGRPFDPLIVRRRVGNTIALYARQNKLVGLLTEQIYHGEVNNNLLVQVLSNVVEFRNQESGPHALHICTMCRILLNRIRRKTDRYHLTGADIYIISTAAALHDVGKAAIPDEILNKPGPLTYAEFEVMKTHTIRGEEMLENAIVVGEQKGFELIRTAREICRWHHERYDGNGYPDGLMGDEIPISAQVVALADIYDALISTRVYKPAYSHERAVEMIRNGECGVFNPLILECFNECLPEIQGAFDPQELQITQEQMVREWGNEILEQSEYLGTKRVLQAIHSVSRDEEIKGVCQDLEKEQWYQDLMKKQKEEKHEEELAREERQDLWDAEEESAAEKRP